MERTRSSHNKLKSIAAIGTATIALAACTHKVDAKPVPATTTETPIQQSAYSFNIPRPTQTRTPDFVTKLQNDWAAVMANHPGINVDISVKDNQSGLIINYPQIDPNNPAPKKTFNTASIIKLSILEEVLIQDQAKNQPMSDDEISEAIPMITQSDNGAADVLWNKVGAAPVMQTFFDSIGAADTMAGLDDYWGLTQTTAADQEKIIDVIANPGAFLSPDYANVAKGLLSQVTPGQRWGIGAGNPADIPFFNKNGWLPNDDGIWTVNSNGEVANKYEISVLTDGESNEQDGINTIEDIAKVTYQDIGNKL